MRPIGAGETQTYTGEIKKKGNRKTRDKKTHNLPGKQGR